MKPAAQFFSPAILTLAASFLIAQTESNPLPPPATNGQQVTVSVTVADRQHQPVRGLHAANFTVYEDDHPQVIQTVNQDDVPICMGLLVDVSGSMRPQHEAVVASLMEMLRVRAGKDSVFLVNFNDRPYLDQDFTSDLAKIEDGLKRASPRGGTAFYDALTASADHLAKARDCQKRVLLAVTDGEDNSSRHSLQQTLHGLTEANTPVIYALAIPDERASPSGNDQARHALQMLTGATGGTPFFTTSLKDLTKAETRLVEELGNQYTITYTSDSAAATHDKTRVEVTVAGQKDIVVRARTVKMSK